MKKFALLAALLSVTSAMSSASSAAEQAPLNVKVYNANEASFHVNSTLVYGDKEAVVIDAGFTKADALRIAANVLDSGKQLTTIFVSQADPDYYFGVTELKEIFPNAKVIATPEVLKVIKKKMAHKIAFWGPKMGANAPDSLTLPEAYQQDYFTVDGKRIEIKGTTGPLAHRPYLWIPSVKAVVGNVGIYGELHAWTADVQDTKQWKLWLEQLDQMAALNPQIVVPGHMKPELPLTAQSIEFTKSYLQRFAKEKQSAKNARELADAMNKAFPQAIFPLALGIGSKVHMGEMKW